jgi:hypothetical protein
MKAVNAKLDVTNVIVPLAGRIEREMNRLRSEGKVKLKKQSQLVKIVGTAPEIFDSAVTKRGIKCGIEDGGAIDKATGWAPDETYLLKTCKKEYIPAEEIAYEDAWAGEDSDVDFYDIVRTKGKISESAFDDAFVREGMYFDDLRHEQRVIICNMCTLIFDYTYD